jgi:hypothetical protein
MPTHAHVIPHKCELEFERKREREREREKERGATYKNESELINGTAIGSISYKYTIDAEEKLQ